VKFSVITPSFKQLEWLQLCISSVSDQTLSCEGRDFLVEHIIQDAGSSGIEDFAKKTGERLLRQYGGETLSSADPYELLSIRTSHGYELRIFKETDSGMYDAVNRGLRKATGERLAYLNCDEQYLPGALFRISEEFTQNPTTSVFFAGCLVINSQGALLAARQPTPLSKAFIQTCHLPVFTASMFFRRDWFFQKQAWFDIRLRDVADAVWVLQRIQEKTKIGGVRFFTTAFTDTGANMNLSPNARREHRNLRASAPRWMRILRPWWIFRHRLGKLIRGDYFPRNQRYKIFAKTHIIERQSFEARRAGGIWWGRLFFREKSQLPF